MSFNNSEINIKTYIRSDIQALRGIAVLLIILFHTFESTFYFGYLGVDIFFVISGFVITPLLLAILKQPSSLWFKEIKFFYTKRFFRLAPTLGIVLAISALFFFFLISIENHEKIWKQGILSIFLLGNFGAYKFNGDYFSSNPNPLVHTWSLAIEQQIYIVIPLILVVIYKLFGGHKHKDFLVLFSIFIFSIIFYLTTIDNYMFHEILKVDLTESMEFYSPIHRIWQFLVGGLIWILSFNSNSIQNFGRKFKLIILLSSLLVLLVIINFKIIQNNKLITLLTIFVASFSIYNKILLQVPKFLFKLLVWLGNRSYSIYLIHFPILRIIIDAPILNFENKNFLFIFKIIGIFGSILSGAILYKYVESKFRVKKNRSFSLRISLKISALSIMVPLVLFVIIAVSNTKNYWGIVKNSSPPPYAGTIDPDCQRDSESGPPCIYDSVGSKTVLLIGDSHAGHYSQAVIDAASASNWDSVIWTHFGCHIQFVVTNSGHANSKCISMNLKMREYVIKNRPDAIIVSQYLHNSSSFIEIQSALLELKSLTSNILIIGNHPIFPYDKYFMKLNTILKFNYEPQKIVNENFMHKIDEESSINHLIWAERNGIKTENFKELFCKNGVCSRFSDGKWLYRDMSHLSIYGADLTVPFFTEYLESR